MYIPGGVFPLGPSQGPKDLAGLEGMYFENSPRLCYILRNKGVFGIVRSSLDFFIFHFTVITR